MISVNNQNKLPSSLNRYSLVKIMLVLALLAFTMSFDSLFFGNAGKGIVAVVKLFGSLFLILGLPFWIYSLLWYKSVSFVVKEDSLVLNEGIIFKNLARMPFTRIHNVNTSNGPLSKIFGLSKIKIWTEGDLVVAAANKKHRPYSLWLLSEDAEWLREFIMSKVK